jgi:spore germination protein KC
MHKYIDFITRDHEIRLSPKVYIVKDGSAKELLFKTSSDDRFITEKMDGFKSDADYLSDFIETDILKVVNMLEDSSVVIPAVKYKAYEDKKIIGKQPEKDVCLCGYAVLKNAALIGYIDKEYARGYNILINEVESMPVNVMDEVGKPVSMDVLNSDVKVKAEFNGDKLEEVIFITHVVSAIAEQHSLEDIFKLSSLAKLSSGMADVIKSDMEKVIAFSQEKKADCIQLGQRLEMAHPYKWQKIKDNWEEMFPELNIKVEVDVKLARSYDIQLPVGAKGG